MTCGQIQPSVRIQSIPQCPLRDGQDALLPFTLKERANEWFFTLGREFDSWRDMEDTLLHKCYLVGKTSVVRRAIRKFSKGPGEVS